MLKLMMQLNRSVNLEEGLFFANLISKMLLSTVLSKKTSGTYFWSNGKECTMLCQDFHLVVDPRQKYLIILLRQSVGLQLTTTTSSSFCICMFTCCSPAVAGGVFDGVFCAVLFPTRCLR